MTEVEIAELENATSITLPETYRRILREYPDFPISAADTDYRPQDNEIYASFDLRWGINVDEADYLREIFPASYFAIGDSGCGDIYAINTKHPDAPVYISGPHEGEYPEDENGGRLPVYDSISEFIEFIRDDINEWQGYQIEKETLIRTVFNYVFAVILLICWFGFALISAAVIMPFLWIKSKYSRTKHHR